MDNLSEKSYYTTISSEKLLGAKEIIKSMPKFYDMVYFSGKYKKLYSKKYESSKDVVLLAEAKNANDLRQIIKNNYLYIEEWDSKNFVNNRDYGFSFLAANIMFIIMLFEKKDDGFTIYSYDASNEICAITNYKTDDFFSTYVSDQEETIKFCNFSDEDMNKDNTKKYKISRKESEESIIESSRGFTKTQIIILLLIVIACIFSVFFAMSLVKR